MQNTGIACRAILADRGGKRASDTDPCVLNAFPAARYIIVARGREGKANMRVNCWFSPAVAVVLSAKKQFGNSRLAVKMAGRTYMM